MTPHTMLDTSACPDCDLQQSIPPLPPGGIARCARCRVTLARNPVDPILHPLALSIAAAIVYIVANTTPLMGLSAVGREATTSIIGGALEMWLQGSVVTAAAVAFCTVIAPGVFIAFMLVVLVAALRPRAPRWIGQLLRIATFVEPWSMSEVMLLGIVVALIKIALLATVIPGIGIYAIGLLVVLLAAITSTFDTHVIWTRVVWADGTVLPPVPSTGLRARAKVKVNLNPDVSELPVVGSTLVELEAKLGSILDKIDKLPIDAIGAGVKKDLDSLDATLVDAKKLTNNVDTELVPTLKTDLESPQRTLASVERAIANADSTLLAPNAPAQQELRDALTEFTRAARSLRVLLDYLERHPKSPIRGKTDATSGGK